MVTDYLAGERKSYQQKIMTVLLKHPLLLSTDDYVSFWHPAFKDYFAARGLEDAIIKENSVESVLKYLGDRRWGDTIVYLAQILDDAALAKLLEYLLGFNNPMLALRCIHQRPSPEHLIDRVVIGLAEAIAVAIEEIPQEISPQWMSIFLKGQNPRPSLDWQEEISPEWMRSTFLLADRLSGLTSEHLSQKNLTKLLVYINHHNHAITDYKLAPEICVEPYLQRALLSQNLTHRLIGLYWLDHRLQASTPFSDNFIAAISEPLADPSFFAGTPKNGVDLIAAILYFRVLIFLLPRIERLARHMEQQGRSLPGWQGINAIQFWESILRDHDSGLFVTIAAIGLTRLKGDRALELLHSLLDHQEAQVRLVAVFGLLNRKQDHDIAGKMMHDPNPIVAQIATYYFRPSLHQTSGRQFRLMVENLITPLAGKISEEMLASFVQFALLAGPLNFFVNPYASQTELNLLGHRLLEQGVMDFGFFVIQSKDKEDKIAALLGGITAQIWVVSLLASGKVSLADIREEIEQTEEFLTAWIKVTNEGRPYVDHPAFGSRFELTNDDIAYIKSWTDHDLTREIAIEVLAGRYKPRLKTK